MTEAEWIGHAVPGLMLRFLGDAAGERRLRLFTCSCAELVWHAMLEREVPRVLELAWAAADGLFPASELEVLAPQPTTGPLVGLYADQVLQGACRSPFPDTAATSRRNVEALAVVLAADTGRDTARASVASRTTLANFLRDIFGNPFRPMALAPEWRTSTALALAAQMYESREFGALPILADALQDAGCDSADVLNHCREPGVHVRGCWVVDGVLGKA
ncbi:Uncharacterized protein (Fragment) OS=uncultured bacterium PE=4 SV=1 [Gemmata massiliana]|uniref:SMI1/KNR4 family protein n=1 Tax=Gemmata massiliana TaxID=1210884 RepID=A0A6P2CWE2_9BACT